MLFSQRAEEPCDVLLPTDATLEGNPTYSAATSRDQSRRGFDGQPSPLRLGARQEPIALSLEKQGLTHGSPPSGWRRKPYHTGVTE